MAFLNPLFLLGALAVAGPLVYHLLLRTRPRRAVLPTLRFLPDSAPRTMAMNRVRNWLLLLLRVLAIGLIAGVFARPYLKALAAAVTPPEAAQGAVFAIDDSLSMQVGQRWAMARSRVEALCRTLPTDSPVQVMTFDRTTRLLSAAPVKAAEAPALLDGRQPGYGGADLAGALQGAAEVADRLSSQRRVVYLISDFQAGGLDRIGAAIDLPKGVEVVPVRLADQAPWNATIQKAELLEAEPGRPRALRAWLASFGSGHGEGTLTVSEGSRRLASRKVRLDNQDRRVELIDLNLSDAEDHALHLALEMKDALAADNGYSLLVPARRSLGVTVCAPGDGVDLGGSASPRRSENPYLAAALAAFGREAAVRWQEAATIDAKSLTGQQAVIAAGWEGYPEAARQAFLGYVQAGGQLIVFPAIGEGRMLGSLAGCQVDGWIGMAAEVGGGIGGGAANADDYRMVGECSLPAPGPVVLGHPRVTRFLKLRAPKPEASGVAVMAALDDGAPFLVRRQSGKGEIDLFAVPLDPRASDFVVRPAFAPFLYYLIQSRLQGRRHREAWLAGELIRPELVGAAPGEMTLDGDGEPAKVLGKDGLRAVMPGFHELRPVAKTGEAPRRLAVLTDPAESDLTPLVPDRIESLARGPGDVAGGAKVAGARALTSYDRVAAPDAKGGFWQPLAWILLVLLLGESLLASRTTV
jgi:hypothetical protein